MQNHPAVIDHQLPVRRDDVGHDRRNQKFETDRREQ